MNTPRTDAAAIGFARILIDHEKHTTTELVEANFARQLECELNAALIAAGCASKERGEWAVATEKIMNALTESVKLQSHYAELLNMHDGGKRMTFTAESWIERMGK